MEQKMMAPQFDRAVEHKPKAREVALETLRQMLLGEVVEKVDIGVLAGEFDLLTRQAAKSINQRQALRSLNKAHRFLRMEVSLLRQLQDNTLRAAVDTLQENGFAVLEPKVQEALRLQGGYVPRPRSSAAIPVPCGKVQREQGQCVDGHLCPHCTYILELEEGAR